MKLPQHAIALLITGFMSLIFSEPANAEDGALSMPKELVGIWGDDEMCMAYHRNDLYYIIQEDGSLLNRHGTETEKWCQITEQSAEALDYKAKCFKSQVSDASIRIRVNSEKNIYEMEWTNPTSPNSTYLHKCSNADKIMGIGKDPRELPGDLGVARHAGFTAGYLTSSAQYCGHNINEEMAQLMLVEGSEAGEKYALEIKELPAIKYGQDLVLKSTDEGIKASMDDRQEIPDFCKWLYEAYGPQGWVTKGFIK